MDQQIEQKIVERGQEFFNSISGEAPSIFNKGWWTGKVMDWSMKNERLQGAVVPLRGRAAPTLNAVGIPAAAYPRVFRLQRLRSALSPALGRGEGRARRRADRQNHGRGHPFQHREHGPPVHHRPERQGSDGRAGQTAQGRLRLYRRPARRSLGQRGGKRRLCRRLP